MALEKAVIDYEGIALSVPREIPVRISRELTEMSKLENSKANDAKKLEVTLSTSEKLLDFLIKNNPKEVESLEDLSVREVFGIIEVWAKKVQDSSQKES